MQVTIFKNITDSKNPFYVDVFKIFERIKKGNCEKIVMSIRSESDKKKRHKLKGQLPSICFSGIFEQRANHLCKQHSGLVALDFDEIENPFALKTELSKDKYIFAAFISPSGNGVKAIVKIPANIETHRASCKALAQHFKGKKLDNFEDIARVCYESFDPEIYINKNSLVFESMVYKKEIVKEIQKPTTEFINDYNVIFKNIQKWIEKEASYVDGEKHKFLVKFSGAANRFGLPEQFTVINLYNFYKDLASPVKYKDFEKIVSDVYNSYSSQFKTSVFDLNNEKYDKKTLRIIKDEEIQQYKIEKKKEFFTDILKDTLVDFDKIPERPKPILSIRDANKDVSICTLQNFSVVHGKPKSKKTFIQSMILAALNGNKKLYEKIIPNTNRDKLGSILFDTEQGKFDVYRVAKRIEFLSGTNENVSVFGLRGYEPKTIIDFIEFILDDYHDFVSTVVIDQVADLLNSINNEEESKALVKKMELWTKKYNIHLIAIVHENKNDNYATGWLGSELMKKAETVIEVKRDSYNKKISSVSSDYLRGEEFESFDFEINEKGIPVICGSPQATDPDFFDEI